MSNAEAPESPIGLIIVGMFTGVVGTVIVLVGVDEEEGSVVLAGFGYLLLWLGGVISGVGVVGTGVVMGMRRADWIIRRRG